MIAVALKGIAGRKLRALLTAFAVVIGVSMVSRHVHPHRHDCAAGVDGARRRSRHRRPTPPSIEKQRRQGRRSAAAARTMPVADARPGPGAAGVADRRRRGLAAAGANVADIIGRDGARRPRQGLARGIDPTKLDRTGSSGGRATARSSSRPATWARGPRTGRRSTRTAAAQRLQARRLDRHLDARHAGTVQSSPARSSYSFDDLPRRRRASRSGTSRRRRSCSIARAASTSMLDRRQARYVAARSSSAPSRPLLPRPTCRSRAPRAGRFDEAG